MEDIITRTVNNRKITADFGWADFRGFSMLFDNPGNGLAHFREGLSMIDCRVNTTGPSAFYEALYAALSELNPIRMHELWQFCALPPHTYHVTAWDGLNDFNREELPEHLHANALSFFSHFPDAFANGNMLYQAMESRVIKFQQCLPITFEFSELQQYGTHALVARLRPADETSISRLENFTQVRSELNYIYEELGVSMRHVFLPHVSLGYYANTLVARDTWQHLPFWQSIFAKHLQGHTITFQTVAPYGFTNMVTFFKKNGAAR